MLSVFLVGGLSVLIFVTLVWLLSLAKKDSGIMDVFWGLGFILLAVVYVFLHNSFSNHSVVLLILVLIWGLRLSIHIGIRNSGNPEDARYAAWRKANGKKWWWFSYFKVFLLQGAVMWIVALPLLAGFNNGDSLNLLDISGIILWLIGFGFEAVGDWQLRKFKKEPANKGKVFNRGLWAYTRHPNYFGEAVLWWGFALIAFSGQYWWIIISPILMTYLLVRVSGVKMLDELMSGRSTDYKEYIKTTNAFIPKFFKD